MQLTGLRNIWKKITNWEAWHYQIKYIPIAPVWLWYCLKARSFWFFTASNPSITFGGFEGEGKEEIYNQLPPESYPKTILVQKNEDLAAIKTIIEQKDIRLPFAVKPNVGEMGYLFRKIMSYAQLARYHEFIKDDYIIQEWVDYPLEISVFYYRMPNRRKGVVTGMLMKEPPAVEGDGYSTLAELIASNEQLKVNFANLSRKHNGLMNQVIPAGKRFILSHASNRSQGGKLKNLNHEIDDNLCLIFDQISLYSKYFFYGRLDIKCKSIESLKEGKDFYILEYNGSGAGIQHIYGNNLSLFKACKLIVHHWEKLYQISSYNNRFKKISYWKFSDGIKFLAGALKHMKELKKKDALFPV